MAVPFGTAVHCVMFCAGMGLVIAGARVALESPDHRHTHTAREVGILTVGLHAAAPPGIPENVDVGRPEGQTPVPAEILVPLGIVVLGTRFVRNHGKGLVHLPVFKGGGQSDGLWKNRGLPGTRHPMQRLIPPLIPGNAQPFNGRRIIHHQRDLLFHSEPTQQVGCPLLKGQSRIEVW